MRRGFTLIELLLVIAISPITVELRILRIMKQFVNYLELLLIAFPFIFLTGCLAPRKHSALAISAQPFARTALLPAEMPFPSESRNFSNDTVLKIGNQVLDTLAKAKAGNLMGPTEVASLLGSNGVPVCLRWDTEARDIGVGTNACAAARKVAIQLGVNQVVRCRIFHPTSSTSLIPATSLDDLHYPGWIGTHWAGDIFVHMQLINLDTLEVVQSTTARGRAEQTIGIFLIFPAGYGTTFGRAVDNAERTALTELFKHEHPDSKKP
jgi:prepilin-type N-terminal cleavage/methylation domain-containing protein